MVMTSWWQMVLAMIFANLVWDAFKLVWVSWRKVMNRDYDGAWWPTKPASREPFGIYK